MLRINKQGLKYCVRFFTCCLVISAVSSCHSSDPKKREEAEQKPDSAVTKEVIAAKKGKLASSIQVPGELIPYQTVDIYAKEASFVKKVLVDVGSEVRQGQLLVSMEAPEI